MKNIINNIDKILKEDEKLSPQLKSALERKKEIISKDKTVRK